MAHTKHVDWEDLMKGQSDIVDSWPMMSGPWTIVSLVAAYLIFVYRIGPSYMKNRSAYDLKKILLAYNAVQVLLSIYICYQCLNLNLFTTGVFTAGCKYSGLEFNKPLSVAGWWYHFAKVTELLDTVFFVLRKKSNQISFLHVYHHSIMALFSWAYLKYSAGGHGAVMALLNTSIHVVMYSYYGLTAFGPRFQKYFWFKKYITAMQMIQFGLMITYILTTAMSPSCHSPPGFIYFMGANVMIFLYLFSKFYRNTYSKSKPKKNEDLVPKIYENDAILKNGNIRKTLHCGLIE